MFSTPRPVRNSEGSEQPVFLNTLGPELSAIYLITPKTPWNRLRTKNLSIAISILSNHRQQNPRQPQLFLVKFVVSPDQRILKPRAARTTDMRFQESTKFRPRRPHLV